MFDLVINQDDPHELALLKHIAKELTVMALKFDALNAAVADVSAKVDAAVVALGTPHVDPADQAAVDAAAVALSDLSARLAAATPAPPAT